MVLPKNVKHFGHGRALLCDLTRFACQSSSAINTFVALCYRSVPILCQLKSEIKLNP